MILVDISHVKFHDTLLILFSLCHLRAVYNCIKNRQSYILLYITHIHIVSKWLYFYSNTSDSYKLKNYRYMFNPFSNIIFRMGQNSNRIWHGSKNKIMSNKNKWCQLSIIEKDVWIHFFKFNKWHRLNMTNLSSP